MNTINTGPPLKTRPIFHIVNATTIKVQWDKPFALPEFDIRNYTLFISSQMSETTNVMFQVSDNSHYPIVHYITNEGVIPKDCISINFTLIATNDVRRSCEGFVIGGFATGIHSCIAIIIVECLITHR